MTSIKESNIFNLAKFRQQQQQEEQHQQQQEEQHQQQQEEQPEQSAVQGDVGPGDLGV